MSVSLMWQCSIKHCVNISQTYLLFLSFFLSAWRPCPHWIELSLEWLWSTKSPLQQCFCSTHSTALQRVHLNSLRPFPHCDTQHPFPALRWDELLSPRYRVTYVLGNARSFCCVWLSTNNRSTLASGRCQCINIDTKKTFVSLELFCILLRALHKTVKLLYDSTIKILISGFISHCTIWLLNEICTYLEMKSNLRNMKMNRMIGLLFT